MRVNALSGLYLISTEATVLCQSSWGYTCQCPLGLIPHFYQRQIVSAANYGYVSMPSRAYTSFLQLAKQIEMVCLDEVCQCPLGLIPHFYSWQSRSKWSAWMKCVNALSGLYLISTSESEAYSSYNRNVSMPSRAYTSFLRYPFKNLGFMRFPEPVFAGIYQNILTAAVFRAC